MRIALSSTSTVIVGLALAGCSAEPDDKSAPRSDAQKIETLAATLQACSYEGEPVQAQAAAFEGAAPDDCASAVNRIMGFTGLPANFVVTSGPVPNAAAVILLDDQRVPRRVIAFNPQFMDAAKRQVGGSEWGPISVMAHEIGHHLSGHTIVPGGSRPEIELEADKFSGFVLHKMGAPLPAATQMILAVGTDHATSTHPARSQRATAIREGWTQSCRQAGAGICAQDAGAVPVGAGAPLQPAATLATRMPGASSPPTKVVLPQPGSTPFKYGRFVIDETGVLDPGRVRAIEAQLYALAKEKGAEFAILVVNDLKGMSAQDYAWAMMRQLRIGKLDVGNGAVAVVAPRQRQAAVAFGPGFAKEAEFSTPDKQLVEWVDAAWGYCNDADGCGAWTDNLFNIFRLTLSNVRQTQWTIRFQTLGELLAHYDRTYTERMKSKQPFDAAIDQPLGNLLRLNGRITDLTAGTGFGEANERILGGKLGYKAVSMMTDDGYPVILYVSPRLAALMPSGALKEGENYTLVGRLQRTGETGRNKDRQASALWLFSYDEL